MCNLYMYKPCKNQSAICTTHIRWKINVLELICGPALGTSRFTVLFARKHCTIHLQSTRPTSGRSVSSGFWRESTMPVPRMREQLATNDEQRMRSLQKLRTSRFTPRPQHERCAKLSFNTIRRTKHTHEPARISCSLAVHDSGRVFRFSRPPPSPSCSSYYGCCSVVSRRRLLPNCVVVFLVREHDRKQTGLKIHVCPSRMRWGARRVSKCVRDV